MQKYITQSGDSWDLIAFKIWNDKKFTQDLINANRDYVTTFIFSAGVELIIPDIAIENKIKTPPWKL